MSTTEVVLIEGSNDAATYVISSLFSIEGNALPSLSYFRVYKDVTELVEDWPAVFNSNLIQRSR